MAAPFLNDSDEFVRLLALECLLVRGNRRYAERVARCLRDEFDSARVTAIECLVTWGCRGMAPRIANKLDDPSPIVRAYGAWGLGRLRAKQFRSRLTACLRKEFRDISRAGLLEALYLFTREVSYAEHLVEILHESDDPQARAFAANSLIGVADGRTQEMVVAGLERALRAERAKGIREAIRDNLKLLRGR